VSGDELTFAEQRAMAAVERCCADLRKAMLHARATGVEVTLTLTADGVEGKARRAQPSKPKPTLGSATP